jgi:hypothetical protein
MIEIKFIEKRLPLLWIFDSGMMMMVDIEFIRRRWPLIWRLARGRVSVIGQITGLIQK